MGGPGRGSPGLSILLLANQYGRCKAGQFDPGCSASRKQSSRRRRRTSMFPSELWKSIIFAVLMLLLVGRCPSMVIAQVGGIGGADDDAITPGPAAATTLAPSSTATNSSASSQPASTITETPTTEPSSPPTSIPTRSMAPSLSPKPTSQPTFMNASESSGVFRQQFEVGNGRSFTEGEVALLPNFYEPFTSNFVSIDETTPFLPAEAVMSNCTVLSHDAVEFEEDPLRKLQRMSFVKENRRMMRRRRRLQGENVVLVVSVDYEMSYTSKLVDVTDYPDRFLEFLNGDLNRTGAQLQVLGLNVTAVREAMIIELPTDDPTVSPAPSPGPSAKAVFPPTDRPSISTTTRPTVALPLSPTIGPTERNPQSDGSGDVARAIIAMAVLVGAGIIATGLWLYCKKRPDLNHLRHLSNTAATQKQSQNENDSGDTANGHAPMEGDPSSPGFLGLGYRNSRRSHDQAHPGSEDQFGVSALSPNGSMLSYPSGEDSLCVDSLDGGGAAPHLADEFDQYRDQSLEKLRADVEMNITGVEGMMSRALTQVLIDEEENSVDPEVLFWGGIGTVDGNQGGICTVDGNQVEASVLGEVLEWLKRNDGASVEERRTFLQTILNRMVASVRQNVLGPEDASRSIHECAFLLDLPLSNEIPKTTLIISGMSKTVNATDLKKAFAVFGAVKEAAIASNCRGFGIIRFESSKSFDRAIRKFRNEEVVVQDIAVQLQLLRPATHSTSNR